MNLEKILKKVGEDCKGKMSVDFKDSEYMIRKECRYSGNCYYKKDYKKRPICHNRGV